MSKENWVMDRLLSGETWSGGVAGREMGGGINCWDELWSELGSV